MKEKEVLKSEAIGDLLESLKRKGKNHKYYYHYTSWESFSKIYNNRSFLLTRGNALSINDQHEALMKGSYAEWNKTYIGSFSFGSAENMAMWGLYGLPWEDAVRIAIPQKAMVRWIDSIDEVYLWDNQIEGAIHADISLSDIVYVNGKKGAESQQLTHGGKTVYTGKKPGLHDIDSDPRMTGYIKNFAWHYENEVRVHVTVPHSTGYDKILVKIPEDVIREMTVMTGPSFKYKNDPLYARLCDEDRISPSGFEHLVKYRPLCSVCTHGAFSRKTAEK